MKIMFCAQQRLVFQNKLRFILFASIGQAFFLSSVLLSMHSPKRGDLKSYYEKKALSLIAQKKPNGTILVKDEKGKGRSVPLLILTARSDDYAHIVCRLLDAHAFANLVFYDDCDMPTTPLFEAASRGARKNVCQLLLAGADNMRKLGNLKFSASNVASTDISLLITNYPANRESLEREISELKELVQEKINAEAKKREDILRKSRTSMLSRRKALGGSGLSRSLGDVADI